LYGGSKYLCMLIMKLATCYTAGFFEFWDGIQIFEKFVHLWFKSWKTWLLSLFPYGILFNNTLTSTQTSWRGCNISQPFSTSNEYKESHKTVVAGWVAIAMS
jgi:hypothetical protein